MKKRGAKPAEDFQIIENHVEFIVNAMSITKGGVQHGGI